MYTANSSARIFTSPFHLVDRSPWPLLTALAVLQVPLSILIYISTGRSGSVIIFSLLTLWIIRFWAKDIVVEGTFQGMHTFRVQRGLTIGYILFIFSEIMFFGCFFTSYLYYVMEPSLWLGGVKFATPFLSLIDPLSLPLLNSALLLGSSFFVTFAHQEISAIRKQVKEADQSYILIMLLLAIVCGILFSLCQWWEYNYAQFCIQDSTYGSLFYLTTGFHGSHVIIGLVFLIISLSRVRKYHFTTEHHVGFEFSALYWHFVDAIWFFVYSLFYVYSYF